jgi:hypothetical protein
LGFEVFSEASANLASELDPELRGALVRVLGTDKAVLLIVLERSFAYMTALV